MLPDVALLLLFSLLDRRDLCRCESVCRRWRSLISTSPQLWRSIDIVLKSDSAALHHQMISFSLCPGLPLCKSLSISAAHLTSPTSKIQDVFAKCGTHIVELSFWRIDFSGTEFRYLLRLMPQCVQRSR